jgi:hypothetical protein
MTMGVAGIDEEFAHKWASVIHEWSARYSDQVAGWWFDGGYQHIHFNEAIARIYADAAGRRIAVSAARRSDGRGEERRVADAAQRIVAKFVDDYNERRLHSALRYIAPRDKLLGRETEIFADRDRKLEAARERRSQEGRAARNADVCYTGTA